VPMDTIKTLEDDRGMELTVTKGSHYKGLHWDGIRVKVKNGMRNATLMATAPNANIGLVAGTTPGIDPRFAQVFSRNKISGKYLDLNPNLANDLKTMGIWEKVRERIIADQGDIADIDGIPQHVKDIYKTSFSTSPYAFIEVAARAQKWIDQSLSRNMYLETRDIDETMDIYSTAWKKGVKSTYYLHMKPRHTAEQSTVRVNKGELMGKRGFAAVMGNGTEPVTTTTAMAQEAHEELVSASVLRSAAASEPQVQVMNAVASFIKESPAAHATATTTEHDHSSHPHESSPTHDHDHSTHQHTTAKPAVASPTSSVPRIMPPSDPMEQFLCDSCQ
ncbi:MAG: hypothetical protein ACRD3K_06225, partial [Edaphobacter sp.]